MKTELVTLETARKYNQTKRYAVISENCSVIWGEGDMVEEAEADAIKNMRETCGLILVDAEFREKTDAELLARCWMMARRNYDSR